ncbi:MAG: ABC transporter ATP-binding protein [Candidatus Heimdallarchaeota archaeon]
MNLENIKYDIVTNKNQVKSILQEVHLVVEEGEFHAIVGPSGSGKTTLLQIIATFLHPTSGKRIIFGEELTPEQSSKFEIIRSKIGYLHQAPYLPKNIKVLKYLELYGSLSGIGLTTLEERIPEIMLELQIEELKNNSLSKLSGGEKQRVALASQILKKNISLLLLDEPTGSLDYDNCQLVWNLIERINKTGTTVIVVTHDITIKSKTRNIHSLDNGKLSNKKSKKN